MQDSCVLLGPSLGGCEDKEAADVLDSNSVHASGTKNESRQNLKKREALPMPTLRSSRFEALDVDTGSLALNRDSPLLLLQSQEGLMSGILKLASPGSFVKKTRASDSKFQPWECADSQSGAQDCA